MHTLTKRNNAHVYDVLEKSCIPITTLQTTLQQAKKKKIN